MQYFGPKRWGLESMPTVDTPVGQFCMYCKEYIGANDFGVMMPYADEKGFTSKPQHRECFVRQMVGSVQHQRGECMCFGYDVPHEDTGMTPRQGALAAVKEYEQRSKDVPTLKL